MTTGGANKSITAEEAGELPLGSDRESRPIVGAEKCGLTGRRLIRPLDPTAAAAEHPRGLRRSRPGTADPGAVHAGPSVRKRT